MGKPEWRVPGLSLALKTAAEQRGGRFLWEGEPAHLPKSTVWRNTAWELEEWPQHRFKKKSL